VSIIFAYPIVIAHYMKATAKKYREKYIENFIDVFDVTDRNLLREKIDFTIEKYLKEKISLDNAINDLKTITQDFEFTPFKWILHHIKFDEKNIQIANRLYKQNPDTVVYKHFETHDYGFNLFSDLYEKEY
jgi:hypothetical protein